MVHTSVTALVESVTQVRRLGQPRYRLNEGLHHILEAPPLRAHLIWVFGSLVGCRWWNGWCRTSCGNCSSGWCLRHPTAPRAAGDADTATGRCWPRSSSWPPPAAPGPNSHPCSVPPGPPRTAASPSGPVPESGPNSTAWSLTNSAPAVSWTGRDARSTRSTCVPSQGGADGSESCRSGQEGFEDPPDHRPVRSAPVHGDLRGQHPRQPGPPTPGARDTAHPFPSRTSTAQACQAARGQGL